MSKARSLSKIANDTPTGIANELAPLRDWRSKNALINGNFDLWQRGTSFTSSGIISTADRWFTSASGSTYTVTRQEFTPGQTDVPGEPRFYFRKDVTIAATQGVGVLQQSIESVRTFAGQTVTWSFWARLSSGTKAFTPRVFQEFGTGGSPSTSVTTLADDVTLTTAWQKFIVTFNVPSISGKTIGTDNNDRFTTGLIEFSDFSTYTIDFAQAQLELGSVATTFENRPIYRETDSNVVWREEPGDNASSSRNQLRVFDRQNVVRDIGFLDPQGNFNSHFLGGFKNALINGNFDIWQRGTSFTLSTSVQYTADRWISRTGPSGAGTTTRQPFPLGQTDVPGEPEFFLRHAQTAAQTGTTGYERQRIESVRSFAGRTVIFSFYARVASGTTTFIPFSSQSFGTGGTPSGTVQTDAAPIVVTSGWQRFQAIFDIPSIAGRTIGTNGNDFISFGLLQSDSTGFTTFTLDLAQAQVELGPVATVFEKRPFGTELALAQRYYFKTFDLDTAPVQNAGRRGAVVALGSGSRFALHTDLPVTMRANPSVTLFNPLALNDDVRNIVDGTDTDGVVSADSNQRSITILNNVLDSTDDGDVMAIHFTAEAEL